jgi:hypothetical protein
MNTLRSNEEARPATVQPPSIAQTQRVNDSTARTNGPNHQNSGDALSNTATARQPENLDHTQAPPVGVVNPAAHAAAAPHDRQHQESATAQAQQHENRANVPWWSRFVSPVWRMVRATQHPQPAVVQAQQHEAPLLSLLSQIQTDLKSVREEFSNVHRLVETMKEECSMKVEEVSQRFRSEVKRDKREAKKEKVKREEEEGKPKKQVE